MQIGIFAALANPFSTPDYLNALGTAAEERGFHSLWVAEHVVLFDEYASQYPYAADGKIPAGGESGMLEPFTALAFLAARTSRIRLGTGICLVPQRNPVYTAKEVAAVDWLSKGRFDFGVGVGWLAEEFRACDVPFEQRAARTRDYLAAMQALWTQPVSSHQGTFYSFEPLRQNPKPVQKPHPPIHFGGESDAALRRVADLGQGWYGFNLLPDAVPSHLARLDRFLAKAGRTRSEIQVSISPYMQPVDFDAVRRYRDAGVDQVILLVVAGDRDGLVARLDDLAKSIVEPARSSTS
ncbi:MAG: LLM class F420-dependent oxidoreductase [Proteobacteria bacterium]|nr:MAG: LLM class F420-dependent oxidoreductase [Pseudomonadota bacterium]